MKCCQSQADLLCDDKQPVARQRAFAQHCWIGLLNEARQHRPVMECLDNLDPEGRVPDVAVDKLCDPDVLQAVVFVLVDDSP